MQSPPRLRRSKLGTEPLPSMPVYKQGGPFPLQGIVTKSALVSWSNILAERISLANEGLTKSRVESALDKVIIGYYFQMCLGKDKSKSKTDSFITFIWQLHRVFVFHKSGVLLEVFVFLCSNLLFVINATIPPKGIYIYDLLHFLCHPPAYLLVSLCLSLTETILLLVTICVCEEARQGERLLHRSIL